MVCKLTPDFSIWALPLKNWKVCLVIKTVHTFTCGVFLLFMATKVKQSFYTCKFLGYFTTHFQRICNPLVAKWGFSTVTAVTRDMFPSHYGVGRDALPLYTHWQFELLRRQPLDGVWRLMTALPYSLGEINLPPSQTLLARNVLLKRMSFKKHSAMNRGGLKSFWFNYLSAPLF